VLLVLGLVDKGGVLVEIDADLRGAMGRSVFTLNVVGVEVLSLEGVVLKVGSGLRGDYKAHKGSGNLLHSSCVSNLKLINFTYSIKFNHLLF